MSNLFTVLALGSVGFHGNRLSDFTQQLTGLLVHADDRVFRVIRPLIHLQHVFHGGYERGIVLRGDTPALLLMRFERCFFKRRPIVLSEI